MYRLLFEKPVKYFPSAIPIELERLDEFSLDSDTTSLIAGEVMVRTGTSWSTEFSSSSTLLLYEVQNEPSHVVPPTTPTSILKVLPRVNKGPSRVSTTSFSIGKNLSLPEPAASKAATASPTTTTAYRLDDHVLYDLKDYQPFKSKKYYGLLEEIKKWLGPLRDNTKLQDALTTYMKPPQTYKRLNDLLSYFLKLGDAVHAGKPLPPTKEKEIEPIIAALSKDSEEKLDEISSVIIISEAECNFPHHIVEKIVGLDADKRAKLKEVILQTPYKAETHAYPGMGPYNDPNLKPIMIRMGFKVLVGASNLQYTRCVIKKEEDLLIAALIVLTATEK